ncbi:putative chromatin assembly factor 1 subunit a protein [Neofusicoccum parvum UCRNP2]|uniref:Putative chromatin assembly factor 1 subunit a protein n=1 Tax=Botryosphaeria parva (strain UCR-NP2) TaxID=1287680 RepID=R1GHT9_BOTPV|nr:putative chromatin assembly factor 1 subunit a protein [Neofusicoccum parvum UCRNP2]
MAGTPQKRASPSRKRPAPDDDDVEPMLDVQATPVKDPRSSPGSSELSSPKSIASADESPLPQRSVPGVNGSSAPNNPDAATAANSTAAATTNSLTAGASTAKRRKFTPQEKEQQRIEKEQQRLEKEAKAKAREEKKQEEQRQKEETKKAREEIKKAKEEELKKKNEEKEAKKREREAEKQKKAEEEEKKKKAQPKLNKWFTMNTGNTEPARSRQSVSAEPSEVIPSPSKPTSPQKKAQASDYEQTFLPYQKKTHEVLAPETQYWADRSAADREAAVAKLDQDATSGSENAKQQVLELLEKRDINTLLKIPLAEQGKRGLKFPRVRDIVGRLQGSSDQPVDLTEESSERNMRELLETLKTVPMKYIHFTEDVRPPYCGTFTKVQSYQESRKMAINPFSKSLPEANYDYDSEYEWEDAEEGEDLDADDEDDLESEGAEDLEDFLEDDDDDVAHNKRRLITGDLEPRTIPEDLMVEFKAAIKDSDLTKIALIEALKKQFPKIPKDAIANTLPLVAKRVGPSANEKRWILLDT